MSFISNIESCEKASNSQDSITNLFIVKLLIIDNINKVNGRVSFFSILVGYGKRKNVETKKVNGKALS